MGLCFNLLEVCPQQLDGINAIAADAHEARLRLCEFHPFHNNAVGACGLHAGKVLQNVLENFVHEWLDADDCALHFGRDRPQHFQAFLIARCAFFKLVVSATYHADLNDAVALRKELKVFRARCEAAFRAYHEGVFCLREILQALETVTAFLFDRLERVTHAAPMNGDIPVAPRGFSAALSLDKCLEAFNRVALLHRFELPVLFLHEAIPAPVAASNVCIEANREIA